MEELPRYLTAKEVMEILRIRSYETFRKLVLEGKIKAMKLGRKWLVDRRSVYNLIDNALEKRVNSIALKILRRDN